MNRKDFYIVPTDAWLFTKQTNTNIKPENEEVVRQWAIHELIRAYGADIRDIKTEQDVKVGSKICRADIVVSRDGEPYIVVETKRRADKKCANGLEQGVSYATLYRHAQFVVYTNGTTWQVKQKNGDTWLPVNDIPSLHGRGHSTEWEHVQYAVHNLAPILYWLDKEVPPESAAIYFDALQIFFHSCNDFTANTNDHLRVALDNMLRILGGITTHSGYQAEKLSVVCRELREFRILYGDALPDLPEFFDLKDMRHYALTVLTNNEIQKLELGLHDTIALKLVAELLGYFQTTHTLKPQHLPVGIGIQHAIHDYLCITMEASFHSRLPGAGDSLSTQELRGAAQAAWKAFEYEHASIWGKTSRTIRRLLWDK